MPSVSTLSLRTRGFRMSPGIIDGAKTVLDAAVQGMTPMERLCVIAFDEVALNGRWCVDQMSDQVLSASKLQLLMVRGLTAAWKQPYYYELDAPMTVETLTEVVVSLEAAGLRVVACVSDMGPTSEKMWRGAGVSDAKTWIPNPADHARRLWVFADAPHLIKLLRTHVMEENGGLLIPNGRGGLSLLGRGSFKELLAHDAGELRLCPKLTDLCVEAKGQVSQRVHLATRTFSSTVTCAMETYVPRRAVQARAVKVVDAWFDVVNSRSPYDQKSAAATGSPPRSRHAKTRPWWPWMSSCAGRARRRPSSLLAELPSCRFSTASSARTHPCAASTWTRKPRAPGWDTS
ncbi:Transposable element P transposase [Amphibalanus amphitrite]|uniref:Transposable element P transposase n=1 Tax=Amphibalanus amphitrite TaxID=1232801 RepID=A0A6A4WRR5_AMPAM|nr:Transposable element P transposase [Amphibalanus amphitrite]